jgi:DNA repair protein RadC
MKIFKSPLPELTLRYRPTSQKKVKVSTSKEAFFILRPLYDDNTLDYLESSVVVFLNRANNTIGWMKLSQGGMSGTVIDGKIIFAAALNCGASGIILSHNHPSGELKPSECDLKLTRQLAEVAKFIDLSLLDHLIITKQNYFSFADEGLL